MEFYWISVGIMIGFFIVGMFALWHEQSQKDVKLKISLILWNSANLFDSVTVPPGELLGSGHPELSDNKEIDYDKLLSRINQINKEQFRRFCKENNIELD